MTFLRAQMVKNLPAVGRYGFDSWVGKIPWRRKWQPTPVFLPGEFLGQRSLVGHSPWGRKGLDTTVRLTFTFSPTACIFEIERHKVCHSQP